MSIINQFTRISLSSSGRPVLEDGEVILATQPRVGLYDGNMRISECDDGITYLTNYGIIWVSSGTFSTQDTFNSIANYGWKLSHSRITDIKNYAGMLKSHPKILVYYRSNCTTFSSQESTVEKEVSNTTTVYWECQICQFSNLLINSQHLKCAECGVKSSVEDVRVNCPVCTFKQSLSMEFKCTMCSSTWAMRTDKQSSDEQLEVSGSGDQKLVKYSFRSGGQPVFLAKLREALKSKAWETLKLIDKPQQIPSYNQDDQKPTIGGLSTIMKNVSDQRKMNEQQMTDAFQDLTALMKSAKEMVDLAQVISTKLSKTESSAEEATTFQGMLVNLGLDDPVTRYIIQLLTINYRRDNAGDLYHQELAKQISEFVVPLLYKTGGMISLAELYCIYNRARGVALISPDDLSKCCKLFETLQMPVRLKKFKSGLKVVQALDFNEGSVVERICGHLGNRDAFLSPLKLSELENISIILAKEHLLTAEQRGKVCRDETAEGLRFYPNRFANKQS